MSVPGFFCAPVPELKKEGARECRVEVLTLYAFSTENWRRPRDEVEALMTLMVEAAQEEALDLQQNGVRFRASGLLDAMPPGVQAAIAQVVALTQRNTQITLNLALNYGGRSEITEAARRLARDVVEGRLTFEDFVTLMCWHDDNHLDQLKRALAGQA